MGIEQIWPNITIAVNIIFQYILAVTKLCYIVSSKRVIVQTKMQSLLTHRYKPISYTHYTWQQITHSTAIDILCKPENCLICMSLPMQKYIFLLPTETYLSRLLYKMYYFLSRPFSRTIIMVSRQYIDVCRQCVEVSMQCIEVSPYFIHSRYIYTMIRHVFMYLQMSRQCLDMSKWYLHISLWCEDCCQWWHSIH